MNSERKQTLKERSKSGVITLLIALAPALAVYLEQEGDRAKSDQQANAGYQVLVKEVETLRIEMAYMKATMDAWKELGVLAKKNREVREEEPVRASRRPRRDVEEETANEDVIEELLALPEKQESPSVPPPPPLPKDLKSAYQQHAL